MVQARKYVVKKRFHGLPKKDDFEIVNYELPPLKDDEILVKTEWISVDPYLRAYHSSHKLPFDQYGYQVGIVQESKDKNYPVGLRVVSHKGWCTHYITNPTELNKTESRPLYKLPFIPEGFSDSLGVGAMGMPGAAAYFGFLEICNPKAGETVVVTGAAGAVGSLVGQIAKIKGCRVIGFAGSDDKVAWLEKDLKFDKAFNYKKVNVLNALKEAAPKGIDCYFDNVGGETSSEIISLMNEYGRVSMCGSISSYNETNLPKATILQSSIISKQLKTEGFLVWRWNGRWSEAFADIAKWIRSGELVIREHITDGFDNIYEGFIAMFSGENFGKVVVKV